ncbi:MAG: DUF2959 domain-containing protein [Deltaproteobacteria bacterium]|jgi:hypothetical protein|nr:DUF2959 domain-containing protein [Deltaproteobacteria bacterium]MBN2844559.1 DUF2959 domain-containing protein [Deltaproteobacteria bacterium]
MNIKLRYTALLTFMALALILGGCQTTYYTVWEKLGKEKRHLLRDNVKKASEEQKEATEQFTDALTRMKEMYGFEGGELEDVYTKLKADFDESESRANAVHDRVAKVERIAEDLFSEWQGEIKQITSSKLRAQSSGTLQVSKQQYAKLHKAMKKAESRMDPVLDQFRDNVLFLKHNLNAKAIGTLKREAGKIEIEVESLIADMQASIAEAETFLNNFQ